MLRNSPITWYVNQCAARLRARTGHDVRVIPSDLFPAWRTSGEQARDRGEPLRSDIHRAKLHEADFVFIVWFLGMHYSLLVLCHPVTSRHDMHTPRLGLWETRVGSLSVHPSRVLWHAGRLLEDSPAGSAALLHMDSTASRGSTHDCSQVHSAICMWVAGVCDLQLEQVECRLTCIKV